jgi:hypothetical protein
MKKKLIIIAILSLNLLALVTDGKCSLGTVTATAQSLGSENKNDDNTTYFDTTIDGGVLPEVDVYGTDKSGDNNSNDDNSTYPDSYIDWGYSVGNVTYGGSSDTGIGEDSNQGSNNNDGVTAGGSSGGTYNGGVTVGGGSGANNPNWNNGGKDTTNWTDQETHPNYYKPTNSEKVLNFNIPKQWEKQDTRYDCVTTTMEYIANYYWGTVEAGYSPMRDKYNTDCNKMFGYDPAKSGLADEIDIYDLMTAENFSYKVISTNQIDANIDAGNPIIVFFQTNVYDEKGNPKYDKEGKHITQNHASMAIGYNKNDGTCIVVDTGNGSIQHYSPSKFLLNIAVTYPYVKLRTK